MNLFEKRNIKKYQDEINSKTPDTSLIRALGYYIKHSLKINTRAQLEKIKNTTYDGEL